MANPSLSHLTQLINQQVEHLSEYLAKAEALVEVALGQDMLRWHSPTLIYHYIWALADFIERAKTLTDEVATRLLKLEVPVSDSKW